jgi:carbon monoxide dehydrogenase subunit G
MTRAVLSATVMLDAPAERVWQALTDWRGQDRWIPLTSVRATAGEGCRVGDRVEAWTGLGPLGFRDPMVITCWAPPSESSGVCEVLHTGRLIRGEGGFEVEPVDAGRSRLTWWESVDLPLGFAGAALWRVTAPVWQAGLRVLLSRLRSVVTAP